MLTNYLGGLWFQLSAHINYSKNKTEGHQRLNIKKPRKMAGLLLVYFLPLERWRLFVLILHRYP
ncbi:hypothetical protein PMIT1342_00351 [Prochlorococcus marinus str. MIT 1342]|uniref:hypothetical protein n=1 Tax=Prochlorococcus TaxID=1218 RepID=UPI0007B37473|nr:hypothetical protein [Prochlorococcus marinus]KZR83559.1 hypothetical protein PMIT1342_00351 [Prochlorococcus marinus str. MIT 1342]